MKPGDTTLRRAHPCAPLEPADRRRLVEENLDLLAIVARRIVQSLPRSVEAEELYADGYVGLVDASEKFDPARHTQFRTYAPRRIHGAMVDGIRDRDPAPRLHRERIKQLGEASAGFVARWGREPDLDNPEDVARLREITGATAATLRGWAKEARAREPWRESLTTDLRLTRSKCRDTTSGNVLAARRLDPAVERSARGELRELLPGLSRDLRMILELCIFDGIPQQDAAEAIGLSQSRISQMVRELQELIRDHVEARDGDLQRRHSPQTNSTGEDR